MTRCAATDCGRPRSAWLHAPDYVGPDAHAHQPPPPKVRRARVNPVSPKRRAYNASEEHMEAYGVAEAYCVGHALDAPGKCFGPLTPHHTLKRSVGGLELAEKYPVVTLCSSLNDGIESDPAIRKWAETHTFNRGGVDYPFLVSRVAARRVS